MIINTCRELVFCSTTPHPKTHHALTSTLSLLCFPSAKSPAQKRQRKPPPETPHKKTRCWDLWCWDGPGGLWPQQTCKQLPSTPAGEANRPSRGLLHIWLAAPTSGTKSMGIFAVCRAVWWTCQYDGQACQFSFYVALPKYVFYFKRGYFEAPFHSSMMSHRLPKFIFGRLKLALWLSPCSCWAAQGILRTFLVTLSSSTARSDGLHHSSLPVWKNPTTTRILQCLDITGARLCPCWKGVGRIQAV